MSVRVGLNLEPGKQIGAFTLGTRLGGGGESQVWSATGDGLTVALKFIHDQSDPFARARLAREATALRRVRHESVIGLFQVGDRDGEAYLALELLDAGTFGID